MGAGGPFPEDTKGFQILRDRRAGKPRPRSCKTFWPTSWATVGRTWLPRQPVTVRNLWII